MPSYHENLKAHLAKNPGRGALVMAVLVVLIIVLSVRTAKWRGRLAECRRTPILRTPMPAAMPAMVSAAERFRDPWMMAGANNRRAKKGNGEYDWTTPACDATWDPAAVAESQALAEMGSIGVNDYGEGNLQDAAGGAVSPREGPSTSQLIRLMSHGTAP
jgi:hypothetical protein